MGGLPEWAAWLARRDRTWPVTEWHPATSYRVRFNPLMRLADMLCQGMEPWNPTPSNGHVINNTDAPWHGCDWSGPAMRRAREWVREVIVQGFI